MRYEIEFKPRAVRDLASLSPDVARRIMERVEALRDDLGGDVKRLTNFTPEYRLRVGQYRVLFEAEQLRVIVYRVKHRRDVYRR